LTGQSPTLLEFLWVECLTFIGRWLGDGAAQHLHLARVACSVASTYAADTHAQPLSASQKRLILPTLPSSTYRLKINGEGSHPLLILLLYGRRFPPRLQRAQISARIHPVICGPTPMTVEVDLQGTSTPEAVSLTTISPALGSYLYTPYSLVNSTIVLTFSGFTSSKNAQLAMI